MSKEAWFRSYERQWNEREESGSDESDDELAQRAYDEVIDQATDMADQARKRERENG